MSALATGGVGFDGPEPLPWSPYSPANLNQHDLAAVLRVHIWSGPNGTGGRFDLVVVPEPRPCVLTILGVLAAVTRKRRQRGRGIMTVPNGLQVGGLMVENRGAHAGVFLSHLAVT